MQSVTAGAAPTELTDHLRVKINLQINHLPNNFQSWKPLALVRGSKQTSN